MIKRGFQGEFSEGRRGGGINEISTNSNKPYNTW